MSRMFDDLLEGMQEVVEDTKKPTLRRHVVSYTPVKAHTPAEIKGIRARAGFTQAALATYMGVSQKTVEAWEAGSRAPSGTANRMFSLMESSDDFTEKYPVVKMSIG